MIFTTGYIYKAFLKSRPESEGDDPKIISSDLHFCSPFVNGVVNFSILHSIPGSILSFCQEQSVPFSRKNEVKVSLWPQSKIGL